MTRIVSFGDTVVLLLGAARRRASGRRRHQRALLGNKGGEDTGTLIALVSFAVLLLLNAAPVKLLSSALDLAPRVEARARGQMVVTPACFAGLERQPPQDQVPWDCRYEGAGLGLRATEDSDAYAGELLLQWHRRGSAGFAPARSAWGFAARGETLSPLSALAGSFVCVLWFVMLAFVGEGADLDTQRRRHPMWEWLLSHPVRPSAVFTAEMLAPISANPLILGAPIFTMGAFLVAWDDPAVGFYAGGLAGIPLAVAAACASKTAEVYAMLRLPARSRGAVLGLLSSAGYLALILCAALAFAPEVTLACLRPWRVVSLHVQFLVLSLMVGAEPVASPWVGTAACWAFGLTVGGVCAWLSATATRRGLDSGFGGPDEAPAVLSSHAPAWLERQPLIRKELLWLWRDRGALVQVFVVPLVLSAGQLFNLRGVIVSATHSWNLMAGGTVLFGSYFLWNLGPRSLLSEGAALWIPLTWPHGLEELLRAKARLWWAASCALVAPLLLACAVRFPSHAPAVAMVAIAWALFSRSLAAKCVTLVRTPSESGEPPRKVSAGQMAATLGTFAFGIGLLSQRWSVALTGIVYSWLTEAAMWQNFRARLPYLFDPWSEELPKPPTLMHAMVAISGMVEVMAVAVGFLVLILGPDQLMAVQAISYAVVGTLTALATAYWLAGRRVYGRAVWHWEDSGAETVPMSRALMAAIALGAALGTTAVAYASCVALFPGIGEGFRAAHDLLAARPDQRWWMALMAVGFAPAAEEYLFRGLLYRALDREWGGWRAVLGSACFFAIYHPPAAWVPVAAVGAVSAVLFRRCGRLAPCVLLHMTYNAIVVWWA